MSNKISKKKNANYSKNVTLIPLLIRIPFIKKLHEHPDFGPQYSMQYVEQFESSKLLEELVSLVNPALVHMPHGQGFDYSDNSDHKSIEIAEGNPFQIKIGSNSNVTKIGALRITFADTTNDERYFCYLPFSVWKYLTHKSTEQYHLRGYFTVGTCELYLYAPDRTRVNLDPYLFDTFDEMCFKMG